MTETYDVIVVGVGAMGAAACDRLARRGARVLGLERFDVPHGYGSSGGQTRLVRLAYYEHPDYVPLLRRAYEGWDELGRRASSQVLYRTGCLYAGPPGSGVIEGTLRSAREHRLDVETLDAGELAKRWSVFRIPESFHVLFETEAGLVLCEQAIGLFAREALRAGCTVRSREAVRSWHAAAGGVRVVTDRSEYHAGHVVFTAGAWTSKLVRDLDVELRTSRQVLGWVWPRSPELYELDRFPCWGVQPVLDDGEGLFYGFPILPPGRVGGEVGLKLARHRVGPLTDPETLDRTPTADDDKDFRPALESFLPDADGPTLALKVCMYQVTPDLDFIVDRHPEHERVTVACGFSGHGFKFAPAIGEALSDLALEGRSDLPIGFLGLGRDGLRS